MHFQKIRELIATGNLSMAFEKVLEDSGPFEPSTLDELLLLQSQFHLLERRRMLNLEDGSVELNRIIYGFLEILREKEFGGKKEGIPLLSENEYQKVVKVSEARLFYQVNQELFSGFKTANQQVKRHLESKTETKEDVEFIRQSLDSLLKLKEKKDELIRVIKKEEADYGNPLLIRHAKEKINYIETEMSLSEVTQQINQLRRMISGFTRKSGLQQASLILLGIILLLVLIITGLSIMK